MTVTNCLDRVAIVTGGARGIGRAIAGALLARGAKVVIADSGVAISGAVGDAALADATAAELGANAAGFSENMSADGAAARAVALAVERFGAIDIVINNAAILKDAFIFKGNVAVYEEVLRNNLVGAYALLAAATPHMREQAKQARAPGSVVNLVSTAGIYGNFGQSAYASAKGGLIALSRIVAMDLAKSGINSNAIAPFAATRVTESIIPANDAQASYKERALRVPASHVAEFAAHLCTPEAKKVTGQLFAVRGREVMLLSQPRTIAKLVTGNTQDAAEFQAALDAQCQGKYTDLSTDLEAFNTEPIL